MKETTNSSLVWTPMPFGTPGNLKNNLSENVLDSELLLMDMRCGAGSGKVGKLDGFV
ncbi:hypothetical protein HanIR_Chr05g0213531 [Helianthus annuus]|nr:hypothetical protein HanIR_Chr05g0213531 [Helianthus annuus]